jgi:hypothetical protein
MTFIFEIAFGIMFIIIYFMSKINKSQKNIIDEDTKIIRTLEETCVIHEDNSKLYKDIISKLKVAAGINPTNSIDLIDKNLN